MTWYFAIGSAFALWFDYRSNVMPIGNVPEHDRRETEEFRKMAIQPHMRCFIVGVAAVFWLPLIVYSYIETIKNKKKL